MESGYDRQIVYAAHGIAYQENVAFQAPVELQLQTTTQKSIKYDLKANL